MALGLAGVGKRCADRKPAATARRFVGIVDLVETPANQHAMTC
jgi:hypothetical protein